MPKSKDKLMILDGNALIHRSFHALPLNMTNKSGEPTNAVYGFASFLIKALREFKPEYIVLTLDKKDPTFRHKKFAAYKATRVKAPDELYAQFDKVRALTKSFNIPIFEKSGFEADDLIGTIAKKTDHNLEKIIVTGDMDTLQLVDEDTKVYTMSRGISDSVLYDKQGIKAKFQIAPEQLIDYKALRGDPSDNIPGVAGIGEKTASELIGRFNSLDNLYEKIKNQNASIKNAVKPRIIELLIKHKKEAYLSKELATIKCDVDINFNLEDARFENFDKEQVIKTLSALEFKSLLPRVQSLLNGQIHASKEERDQAANDKFERNSRQFKYILVDSESKFSGFLKKLKQQKYFTFDTETSGLDPLLADLLGISFSWEKGEAYYLVTRNTKHETKNNDTLFNYNNKQKANGENQKLLNPWLAKLKPIFEDGKIMKYAHNLKFDMRVMQASGIDVKGRLFDTMIAAYLLNPGNRQYNLDSLAFSELGFEKISKDDLLGKGRDKISFDRVETEKLSLYSCEDADFTMRLAKKLSQELKSSRLEELFETIEMPLVKVLAEMENNGIQVDKKMLNAMDKKLSRQLKSLENKIYKEAGGKFNINSTQQLREMLYENLDIPADNISKTKTGLSTSAVELAKLKGLHPIIPIIQEYRELNKLITTYIHALPKLINPKTKRLHTNFNQTIAATGRLSSTDPNLQNIPVRTGAGRKIRRAFGAAAGWRLFALDYSQIELRLAAHMANDKKMIDAFKNNEDIHRATAAEINRVKPEEVTPNMRREAKAINFGILYGQGPHGLSQTADIPYSRAKDFIDQYFISFKNIKKYIESSVKKAREDGFVETLFGRRRRLEEINSSVAIARKAAERMAINTPLQGTAADMIKIAMIEVEKIIDSRDIKMILQVHDELIFEVKNGQEEKYMPRIKNIMENVIKLKVPVVCDVKAGGNWGEMEEVKTYAKTA